MSDDMICEFCRFWKENSDEPYYGSCVRYPPSLYFPPEKGHGHTPDNYDSPMTFSDSWCGEWSARIGE